MQVNVSEHCNTARSFDYQAQMSTGVQMTDRPTGGGATTSHSKFINSTTTTFDTYL